MEIFLNLYTITFLLLPLNFDRYIEHNHKSLLEHIDTQ